MLLNEINVQSFLSTNWYYIAALPVSIFVAYVNWKGYLKKSKDSESPQTAQVSPTISSTISPTNTITINVGNDDHPEQGKHEPNNNKNDESVKHYKIDALKSKIKILFIDDDKKFNVVKILKDSGWKNTVSIIDIKSIDIQIVKESDIFFVDINGVGKLLMCEHEGLDIA